MFYFAIVKSLISEKLKKGEVKIEEVQIAGKLEDMMCRTATAEETYVECSSYSDAGNDFSW